MKKILSLVLAILMSLSVASMIGATEEVAAIAEEDTAVVAAATEEEVETQFDEAIRFLQEYGIYKGKGDGKLGAADPIERYQMALFVARISTGWVDDEQWKVWWVGTDATVAEEWYDREHDVTGFTDLEGTPATNYLGALSYAAAALSDHPFSAIAPCVAFLGDYPDYFDIVSWPGNTAKSCANKAGMTDEQMYAFLSYFDTKNLATRISCPVIASANLQDGTCPPHTNLAPYNNLLSTDKEIYFYPLLQHVIPSDWPSKTNAFFKAHMK